MIAWNTWSLQRGTFTASVPDLIRLLSTHLYPCPEVFLRELISNAYDAIVRRHGDTRSARQGRIRVTGRGRTVIVEDNGIGMTRQDLIELLTCIGRSATRSFTEDGGTTVGRFGLGFLSALAVADRIRIETRAARARADRPLCWNWEKEADFTIGPGSRDEPGTTVEVELNTTYAGFACRSFLADQVRTIVPFLNVGIDLAPGGDPRPSRDFRRGPGVVRDSPELRALPHWGSSKPPHVFASSLEGGGYAVLALPAGAAEAVGALTVCHRGVVIEHRMPGLLPDGWQWISGVIDLDTVNLTLSRGDLRRDETWSAVRIELASLLKAELIYLAEHASSTLHRLAGHHRAALVDLLLHDQDLLRRVGPMFPFQTSLGSRSFAEAHAAARPEGETRTLFYLRAPPQTDARWSTARAHGKVVVSCPTAAEEALLAALARHFPATTVLPLEWGIRHASGPEAPAISPEMMTWIARLRVFGADLGIAVEANSLDPDGVVAVVELPVADGEAAGPPAGDIVNLFFQTLLTGTPMAQLHARLMINTASATVMALAELPETACPLALSAALLFALGSVQSGLPLPAEWQPVLDRLIRHGLGSLVETACAAEAGASPHIICFFAHEFAHHKPLLAVLRRVLEHEPWFWEVRSAEDRVRAEQLYDSVKHQIAESHVVVAEISRGNPNVLFEAGLATGLGGGRQLLLLAEEETYNGISDLNGHLLFRYRAGQLADDGAALELELRRWLARSRLPGLRRHRPFIGYRLLVDRGVIPESGQGRLEQAYPDPFAFLIEPAEVVSRVCSIPVGNIDRAQRYFQERLDRHGGQSWKEREP